jgi:hypothetical protein
MRKMRREAATENAFEPVMGGDIVRVNAELEVNGIEFGSGGQVMVCGLLG